MGMRRLDEAGGWSQAADESALQRSWLLTVANICVGNRAALDDAEHSKQHIHTQPHTHAHPPCIKQTRQTNNDMQNNNRDGCTRSQCQLQATSYTKFPSSFSSACEYQSLSNMRNAKTMAPTMTMAKRTTGNQLRSKCKR